MSRSFVQGQNALVGSERYRIIAGSNSFPQSSNVPEPAAKTIITDYNGEDVLFVFSAIAGSFVRTLTFEYSAKTNIVTIFPTLGTSYEYFYEPKVYVSGNNLSLSFYRPTNPGSVNYMFTAVLLK